MGRIKKVATERHAATASPFISNFVQTSSEVPLPQLRSKLDSFPQQWPFPRGDLYHWIPLLDRFDHLLELFNSEYSLAKGPQQEAFDCRLLKQGDGVPQSSAEVSYDELSQHGFSEEGDRELVESILDFSRILLEHCGNRSLYASSSYLNDILHTTSPSLLRKCLRLSLRLAQRYQVARYKNTHPHAQAILLQNHYNFSFDRLQKIAQPFPRPAQSSAAVAVTPKGKERSTQVSVNSSDLVAIAKEPKTAASKADFRDVHLTYYEQPAAPSSRPGSSYQPTESSPTTPTPVRRSSALGPSRDRPSMGGRTATASEVTSTPVKSKDSASVPSSAPKSLHIPAAKISDTPDWALVKYALPDVPQEYSYDVLNRVRIAKAFSLATHESSLQTAIEIRLLAVANLAYALGESKFQERIGQADHEEPKRYHLAQQLCDLLQPPTHGQDALPLHVKTSVLLTIEALSKIRHKATEICDCLQIAQNHGILYYELRKVIETLGEDDHEEQSHELRETEWREAAFDLTNAQLAANSQGRPSAGDRMVSAGIMSILAEALNSRTPRAQRFYEKVLHFFDTFIHNIPVAIQTLANIKGFDTIAELTSYEVTKALETVKNGNGLSEELKSKVVDYEIPFHQQATLRQLFKFIAHMFEHNAGTHDRVLRNLVDTPQILGALRNVIENASLFGSNVWSGAVNIMSSFIHNEPTSFQVVGEAGLVKSLLQTVVPWELKDSDDFDFGVGDVPTELEHRDDDLIYPVPKGILPVGETMCDIPTAFGAICLNENGMKMFQSSKALLKYMDIFVSPPHVRALEEEGNTAAMIGQAFDELSRHHPQLKEQIMRTVIVMVKRVGEVCRHLAETKGVGAKLWERSATGIVVAGGRSALAGEYSTSQEPVHLDTIDQLEKDRVNGVPFISACFKFLDGFFHNQSMCSYFCDEGGAIYLLDLATSSSNPHDLVAFPVFSKITQVLKAMCDAKPHLVLPSLIDRTRTAISSLKPLMNNTDPQGAFATFTDLSKPQISSLPDGTTGTIVVKSLAVLHMLTHILGRALAPQQHSSPRHPPIPLFSSLNFADIYIELVDRLSELHATCLWENLALQKNFSKERREQTDPRPFIVRRVDANGVVELAAEVRGENQAGSTSTANGTKKSEDETSEDTYALKNAKALRYLLSQAPMGIEAFLHSLGQTLTPKRNADSSAKQYSFVVADHIAKALVWEIGYKKFGTTEDLLDAKYTGHIATACSRILLRNSHNMDSWGSKEALTLVLNKFYVANGFGKLNDCIEHFSDVLGEHTDKEDVTGTTASDVLSTILSFYSQVVKSKSISEASQSRDLGSNQFTSAEYFLPGQMVIEIRDAVLPAVSRLWHSTAPLDDKANHQAKTVIDILRTILKGEGEENALKRSKKATRRSYAREPEFTYLQSRGQVGLAQLSHPDERLAREALYRCNYSPAQARDYCALRGRCDRAPSFPVSNDNSSTTATQNEESAQPPTNQYVPTTFEQPQSLERQESVEMTDATLPAQTSEAAAAQSADDLRSQQPEDGDAMSDDSAEERAILGGDQQMQDLLQSVGAPETLQQLDRLVGGVIGAGGGVDPRPRTQQQAPASTSTPPSPKDVDTGIAYTTLEDLDEKRTALRADLIDRCLEVLSAQPNVSFDLADLIQAAVTKTGEGWNRAEIGTTLVSSLLSLQGEESSPESGAKISAYAHLVALILQDRDFFESTLDELKEYFDVLVSWIQIGQDQKAEDMPWIEMILLIIERVLAEDEQPAEISWKAPSAERPLESMPEPKIPELNVPIEARSTLFDTLIDVLPKIGKNPSLALSVCRVLVILTRRRDMALRLSEKSSMSRMFLMIRQLAGSVDDKLQSAFMIILRHMVEDETILRQIMRTEIKTTFENHRSSRPMDMNLYSRNLYHLILRDPELFAKVTQEVVEIARYDGSPHRTQSVTLKKEPVSAEVASEATVEEPIETEEGDQSAQKSIEGEATENVKAPEAKAPAVEITDGVVQFLLRELSNYRDVEDKISSTAKESPEAKTNGTSEDVEMSDASTSTTSTLPAAPAESNAKTEKPTFKPEEHTIYIYRCFILQCLAELLASYNRTKVEFINFSRKPEAPPATPSKPRAGTLNYLLNVLVPIGTLEHRDDIAHRKKLSTSAWATTVVVSLCSRTPEFATSRELTRSDDSDEQSDLTFVRKFVLEHALRAFKEATASTEQLDLRYSRLLALADLFNRVLSAKTDKANIPGMGTAGSARIGQLMYERNFIPALTSAIAELDLNFPNAKRTVKYLLGPLKNLTDLGVWLSQNAELSSSTGGTTDEDDISSATSLSDEDEDEREQTPDLYRNSTLGMFESNVNHDDDTESTSEEDEDDEDMYDGYDEEMDYEGDPMPDHGDVVSDEDEDIDGDDEMGPIEGMPGDIVMDDIVVDEEGEETEEEDGVSYDEDDEDEEHDEDDVDFGDHMDEITGDDENASIPDHDEGEDWEDDDELADHLEHDEIINGGSPHGGPLDQLARVVAGEDDFDGMDPDDGNVVTIDVENPEEDYFDDEMPPEDDDDEDEEVDYENDVVYEPEIEEDDEDGHDPQWEWGAPPPPPAAIRGHHHHYRHGFHDMFNMMRGEPFSASGVRSHRSTNARGEDDGSNPLLQRDGASGSNSRERAMADTSFPRLGRRTFLPRQGDEILQHIINNVAGGGPQAINVNIEGRLGGALANQMAPMFAIGDRHTLIDIDPSRPWREQIGLPRLTDLVPGQRGHDYRTPNTEEAQAVEFRTIATVSRWQEEAKMLFGNKYQEKATRVINTLLRLLVPAAMEAKKQRDKAEAERKAAEEKAREEEKKRLEAEKAEREAREAKEREEREAREAEEARAREEAESQQAANEAAREETSTMEGVEASQPVEASTSAAEGSQPADPPAPRITTTIRGRDIDITNLGIDLSYLEALPEEIREEVIMGQFAEQRSQAAQTGEQPNEISRDFLDALPPEIQRELLRSEAMDRRRREAQETRRRAAEQGNAQPAQAEDMNNADFMAMLDPTLRQAILMDADETTLATLPEDIQAEARTLLGSRRVPRLGLASADRADRFENGGSRNQSFLTRAEYQQREAERQRRPVAQMLDKAGIATLLRLMFVSLHQKAKSNLHSVLSDVCKNTQNRAEVISILLSILQDGTADVNAVERSFAALSLRAKQNSGPKTPQPVKRTATGTVISPAAELSPLNIVQQCLATLNALSSDNNRVPTFFLTEHETVISQKTKAGKKGKGGDSKAAKFPLNALLTLLDRKLITENPGVMETLAALLNRVTRPLSNLFRRAIEDKADGFVPAEETGETQNGEGSVPDVQMGEAAGTSATTTAADTSETVDAAAESSTAAQADAQPEGQEAGSTAAKVESKRKHRDLVAPDVPEDNIRLVANIFTARECSSKTMQDTLEIIKHLSYIPGAQEIFGKELVRQAHLLSEDVLSDLQELREQIDEAESDTSLQGVALAKFSSATSKQQKFLRTVTALDHLCDPEQMPGPSASSESESQAKIKEGILVTLYENPTFDKLWDNLSQCLTAIRKKGNMINVAAILLPLIESLMVVCRNSTLKEPTVEPASPVAVSSTPPAARLETLFFRFTEEHRKILNELIRTNAKLMNGKFAVLAKNSKVLEFDNKRSYFNRKVHTRPMQGGRSLHPSLALSVRRDQVFLDSFKSLYYKTGEEVKYGKLNIRFHGEEGIDAGGVSREWFAAMARQMFNPDYALFNPVASDRTTFHPNPLSEINGDHLTFFKFIGRIIAKALYEGRVLDCHFSRAVYRRILGKSVSLKDMESLDLDYYKSLVWILENDITDITFETFSVDVDRFGATETVDLIPNGQNIPVTEDNKQEYVRLVVEHRLVKSVEQQLEHFLAGFYEIIPAELISIFNEQELELLISGLPDIDIDDWKNNTEYHNYQATSPQIQWFWRAVRSFDKEEKAKLLQFVTGTSKVPLNGFKELEGMNGFAKFNIHRDYSSKEKLPSSHTCFNQLDLPEYESYEHLRQQMYTAITAGSEYFGFA